MITVRRAVATFDTGHRGSEPVYEVFDVITGALLVSTRDCGRAVAIAVKANSGE